MLVELTAPVLKSPPPMIMNCCCCAGGRITLVDWSRSLACAKPASGLKWLV